MEAKKVSFKIYSQDTQTNRKELFQEALKLAKHGKVLYIMCEEMEELPQLSQELTSANWQYMKLLRFMYVKTLDTLLESLSTLPDWQIVPSAIILDDLSVYCGKTSLHSACGLVALLLDSTRSCGEFLKQPCSLCISFPMDMGQEYHNTLKDLYFEC